MTIPTRPSFAPAGRADTAAATTGGSRDGGLFGDWSCRGGPERGIARGRAVRGKVGVFRHFVQLGPRRRGRRHFGTRHASFPAN